MLLHINLMISRCLYILENFKTSSIGKKKIIIRDLKLKNNLDAIHKSHISQENE